MPSYTDLFLPPLREVTYAVAMRKPGLTTVSYDTMKMLHAYFILTNNAPANPEEFMVKCNNASKAKTVMAKAKAMVNHQ